ncbi:hypothetical protein EJ08DRAFT_150574 [Tothia fuscella]|uniref:Uncharacterized protein n=1 Tax=Tothia fuscella TaxID=1048955 RepID=A0A9P4P3E1_9PEZI|nr:hypothetical protein EJ08DRAFT_150574 [Tothia fuscella]
MYHEPIKIMGIPITGGVIIGRRVRLGRGMRGMVRIRLANIVDGTLLAQGISALGLGWVRMADGLFQRFGWSV